jgi:hypothetical protein
MSQYRTNPVRESFAEMIDHVIQARGAVDDLAADLIELDIVCAYARRFAPSINLRDDDWAVDWAGNMADALRDDPRPLRAAWVDAMKRAAQVAAETYRESVDLLLDMYRAHYRETGDDRGLASLAPYRE